MQPSIATYSMILILLAASLAQAEDRYPTFIDSAEAGPDFKVQGCPGNRVGTGEFEGLMYRGGLPGAGWDGSQRSYFRGKTEQAVTKLCGVCGYQLEEQDDYWQATIQNGTLRGTDESFRNQLRDVSFVLRKVRRKSPTLGARPPRGATVLFDGTGTDAWKNAQIVERDLLDRGAKSRQSFDDHRLHLEFRTPFMPTARGMHRGNSGVLIRDKYEIQIVDSFGWTFINRRFVRNSWVGRCGGIEEVLPPDVNMSYPPLSYRRVLPPEDEVRPDRDPGRLYLQEHHDRVAFRNIWVVSSGERRSE